MTRHRKSWRTALLLLIAFVAILALRAGEARAALPESKIFIYLIYNKGNASHRAFAETLFKKFNSLGFADRMKKKGVSWVEANYVNVGAVADYLHIAPDDIIYFGVLMADKTDRITREMYRATIPVSKEDDEKSMRRAADSTAHKFYFELADVVDNFDSQPKRRRQTALLSPTSEKAGGVRINLNGKDITKNTKLFPKAPFMRTFINVVMVPFSKGLWKQLGADDAGTAAAYGGRTMYWVKKGTRRINFEIGPALTDKKTYVVNYATSPIEKRFINPTKPTFAYPEQQGSTLFVPLRLVMQELYLPYDWESEGFTVNLTSAGSKPRPGTSPSPDEENK